MSIATEQAVVDALPGIVLPFIKAGPGTTGSANGVSLWRASSLPPAAAGIPTAAVQCTRSTSGAFTGWADPPAGQDTYLATFSANNLSMAPLTVYDRLIHSGGLSGTATGAQTTNLSPFPAIPRGDVGGVDVELWLEVYVALGATGVTATVSYTNQSGVSGRSGTATIPANAALQAMYLVALQAGDYGVRSVESVTLSASTGTVGNFGVTLLRRLWTIEMLIGNFQAESDWIKGGLPIVEDGACLALMAPQSPGNIQGPVGFITLVQG